MTSQLTVPVSFVSNLYSIFHLFLSLFPQTPTHIASGKIPEIIVTLLVHTKKKKTMGKVMKVFKTLINELFGTKREYKVEGL